MWSVFVMMMMTKREREGEREMDGEVEGGSAVARFSVVWKM